MKYRDFCYILLWLAALIPVVADAQDSHYQTQVESFRTMRPVDSTDVVMLGSGLVEYAGDWNVLLNWRHVRNRGIAGDNAAGMEKRLGQLTDGKPKMLFLMAGIDELIAGKSVTEVYAAVVHLIEQIRQQSPTTKLFVQSVLPINEKLGKSELKGKTDEVAALNVRLRHYCQSHKIGYINLFRSFVRHGTNEMRRELTQDGLLLTPFGYKLWAFELRKYLLE